MTPTITTSAPHNFREGDLVILSQPDPNASKWLRFWHWITFRDPPQIVTRISHVESTTQFRVE